MLELQTEQLSGADRCAQEPIHILGLIQPHGLLFALSEPELIIQQVSNNVGVLLGVGAEQILGRSFSSVLRSPSFQRFRSYLRKEESLASNPLRVQIGADRLEMLCVVHRRDGVLILECELPPDAGSLGADSLTAQIGAPLARMERASGVLSLSQLVAEEIRRITGFHRVMVYRFDSDWNGEVIAESSLGANLYKGLQFPASDIPAQARRMLLATPLRTIADVDAVPARIVPEVGPLTGRALDLTGSHLRSTAAVHLEYLRNMGVRASMTVSIVVNKQLWGLITCHHRAPKRLGFATRSICELLGQILNAQLSLTIDNAALQARIASQEELDGYMADLEAAPSTPVRDLFQGARLLRLLDADGLVARIGGTVSYLGEIVDEDALLPVIGKLRELAHRGVAASHALGALDASATKFANRASGALYIGLTEETGDYLLLLRHELMQTVTWAGHPAKAVSADPHDRVLPRTSFEAWSEQVRGTSRRWSDLQTESARLLREQMLHLREAQRREDSETSNAKLEALNAELESFSYSVSHDLRSPARALIGFANAIVEDHSHQLDAEGLRLLSIVEREAVRMGGLIDDLLAFSRLGRATMDMVPVNMDALAHDVVAEQLGFLGDLPRPSVEIGVMPNASGDASLLRQVWSNLVSNALKYSGNREGARVRLWGEREGRRAVYHVADNGVGFDMRYADRLFGVFQRLHRNEEFAGNGVGLAIVARIVKRHGGEAWAQSELGTGSTFSFTLPTEEIHE